MTETARANKTATAKVWENLATAIAASKTEIALNTLFKDNFDSGKLTGWIYLGVSPSCVPQYKCLRCGPSVGKGFIHLAVMTGQSYLWTDYVIYTKIMLSSINASTRGAYNLSVTGRLQSTDLDSHGYIVQFYDGLARIVKWDENGWPGKELASSPFPLEDDVWYNIRVNFRGSTIKFYVNDILIVSANDTVDPYLRGSIGLRVGSTTVAYYDEVAVVKPY